MKMTEGHKMFVSVMAVFVIYVVILILFEDYDRVHLRPLDEVNDWHMLLFSLIVMACLSALLYRYARQVDERISRTQIEKEERMRRELTNNIAHELKTPVSSILGYMETLVNSPDIDDETRRLFIERSYAQTQRLATLLQDISTLNRMDYATHLFTKERVDVSEVVAEVLTETAPEVKKKDMRINNYLPQDLIVYGNSSLIYSVFRNLMDNAVKYAGDKATVDISVEDKGTCFAFTFKDDGQGISAEHLPRIFERFYRVDKGRSRSLGGTGLGLAIVKNAVMHHQGEIQVVSDKQKGVAFYFTLSKK